MPRFDFTCQECGKQFDVLVSNADKHKVSCPECGTNNIKQMLSLFNTTKSGGKSDARESCHCCSNSSCAMRH